ncbi:MAG: MCE family protein [Bdellovibrionales bacterium]|nr:MCE family protein [Bdellovibrionales bacterium]
MKIKDYSMELKVGLLVGIGIFVFIWVVMSLGSGGGIFKDYYQLKLKLESSEGIGPGSAVQLIGVPVGNVKTVDIMPEEKSLILTLSVDEKFKHLITQGSTAGPKTQGALGDKFILIEPGEGTGRPLEDDEFLITRADRDLISTLTGGNGFAKFFDVLSEVEILFKNLNANGRSAEMMQNLTDSTQELKNLLSSTNVIMGQVKDQKKIEKTLAHLESVMRKLDNGEGTLGALINDPSIHDGLKSFLGGTKRSKYMKGLIRQTIETGKD